MLDNLFIFSNNLLNALFIAVLGMLIAFVLGEILRLLLRRIVGNAFARFAANLLRLAIAIWTVKIMLDFSGAAGMAVILATVLTGAFSLGSERFAADIVSGVKLFSTRPYVVGDHVKLGEYNRQSVKAQGANDNRACSPCLPALISKKPSMPFRMHCKISQIWKTHPSNPA